MNILNEKLAALDEQFTAAKAARADLVRRLDSRITTLEADREAAQQAFHAAADDGGDYERAWATVQAATEALAIVEAEKLTADRPLENRLTELRGQRSRVANALARLDDVRRDVERLGPDDERVGTLLLEARSKDAALGHVGNELLLAAQAWIVEKYQAGVPGVWQQCQAAIDLWFCQQFDRLPRVAA